MQRNQKNGTMSMISRWFKPSVGPVLVKQDVKVPEKLSDVARQYFSEADVKKALNKMRAGDDSKVPESLVSTLLPSNLRIG
jgi:tagatose-1,6-bisphosphate aldolase non-catalytic subunit AgaZ/GatZ